MSAAHTTGDPPDGQDGQDGPPGDDGARAEAGTGPPATLTSEYDATAAAFDAMTAELPRPAVPRRPVAWGRRTGILLAAGVVVVLLVVGGVVQRMAGTARTDAGQTRAVGSGDAPARHPELGADALPTDVSRPLIDGEEPITGHDGDRATAPACPQYAGRVVGTQPSAAVTSRVNTAWQRIETWLARHAPADAAALAKPAAAARIDAVQQRMSVPFPPDLVVSLRRHDGIAGRGTFSLPPFFRPLSLQGIVDDWQVQCSVLTGEPDVADDRWHRRFVPFAESPDGGSLVVDQRPGGHGRVGEFYDVEGTSFEEWPASVTDLLDGVATSLETGRPYADRYRPHAGRDGHLAWDIL